MMAKSEAVGLEKNIFELTLTNNAEGDTEHRRSVENRTKPSSETFVTDAKMSTLATDDIKLKKNEIRNWVWGEMERRNLIQRYPETCFERIPNFFGCDKAAERLSKTREFQKSDVIKVNPSLAQMSLRFLILSAGKTLWVPSPALTEAFMYEINSSVLKHHWQLKRASSKKGAEELGTALDVGALRDKAKGGFSIDLYVVASVAVAQNGVRLGKGKGFAELEWAILHDLGIVDSGTKVVTTVHEVQLIDNDILHPGLMESHDLPVDLIVTQRRIINTKRRHSNVEKPCVGVLWDRVTKEMWDTIPILDTLKPAVTS